MSQSQLGEILGYLLGFAIVVVAATLTVLQWIDRRRRSPDLPMWDLRHFRNQDIRRFAGSGLMVALAGGLVYGNSLAPNLGNRINPTFLQVWIGVGVLLIGLLSLALIDWLANRAYANRLKRQLERERITFIQGELARQAGRVIKRPSPYDQLFEDSPN